jgi:hypothetical protein
VVLPAVVIVLNAAIRPQFDRWRLSWVLVWARRILVGLPQVLLICTTLPFLVVGVFHPAREPMAIALVAMLPGLMHVGLSSWNGDGFNRQIADAWVLVRATPRERRMLLSGWRNDNFYRRRALRVRPWDYTNLPRIAGMLAQLGAESAHATTAVHMTLPWGESVRLDHTSTQKFLRLAEQALDEVDSTFPTQMSRPGTIGHRIQQIARADLAGRRSTVAQYLDDFEDAIAASRQAADHYNAANAPAHAATSIIHTADRLSAVGQHEAAAELLAEVPDDLPPPIRRLLLAVRAAAAQRSGRNSAARSPNGEQQRERSPTAAPSRFARLSSWSRSNSPPSARAHTKRWWKPSANSTRSWARSPGRDALLRRTGPSSVTAAGLTVDNRALTSTRTRRHRSQLRIHDHGSPRRLVRIDGDCSVQHPAGQLGVRLPARQPTTHCWTDRPLQVHCRTSAPGSVPQL